MLQNCSSMIPISMMTHLHKMSCIFTVSRMFHTSISQFLPPVKFYLFFLSLIYLHMYKCMCVCIYTYILVYVSHCMDLFSCRILLIWLTLFLTRRERERYLVRTRFHFNKKTGMKSPSQKLVRCQLLKTESLILSM